MKETGQLPDLVINRIKKTVHLQQLEHRRPKLGSLITASFDTVLHITNNLKTLYEKFNISL